MNKSEYHRYLAGREWALLKEQVRKRSGGKCERCLVGNHDATHHLTYERIYHENLDDLQAVCDPCHEFLSGKSDKDPVLQVRSERVVIGHIFVYGVPWLELLDGTLSNPLTETARFLERSFDHLAIQQLEQGKLERLEIYSDIYSAPAVFGVIPNPWYPGMSWWAARQLSIALHFETSDGLDRKIEALIASELDLRQLYGDPLICLAKIRDGEDQYVEQFKDLTKDELKDAEESRDDALQTS